MRRFAAPRSVVLRAPVHSTAASFHRAPPQAPPKGASPVGIPAHACFRRLLRSFGRAARLFSRWAGSGFTVRSLIAGASYRRLFSWGSAPSPAKGSVSLWDPRALAFGGCRALSTARRPFSACFAGCWLIAVQDRQRFVQPPAVIDGVSALVLPGAPSLQSHHFNVFSSQFSTPFPATATASRNTYYWRRSCLTPDGSPQMRKSCAMRLPTPEIVCQSSCLFDSPSFNQTNPSTDTVRPCLAGR